MFITEFFTITVLAILGPISPGPDFVMVVRNTLKYSRRVGMYTAMGITLGLVIHIVYSVVGIGVIIAQSILLFNIIKIVGAGYLMYIGYKSLRAKPHSLEDSQFAREENEIGRFQAVRMGFLTNALNPKVTIFFLSLFAQVINPATPRIVQFLYGFEIMFFAFVWFSIVAILLSHDTIRIRVVRVQHYIERVMGIALIALGIKVATSTTN